MCKFPISNGILKAILWEKVIMSWVICLSILLYLWRYGCWVLIIYSALEIVKVFKRMCKKCLCNERNCLGIHNKNSINSHLTKRMQDIIWRQIKSLMDILSHTLLKDKNVIFWLDDFIMISRPIVPFCDIITISKNNLNM